MLNLLGLEGETEYLLLFLCTLTADQYKILQYFSNWKEWISILNKIKLFQNHSGYYLILNRLNYEFPGVVFSEA